MGFELGSGTLYFENKPIGEIDSGLVEVEEDRFYIPSEHPYIKIPPTCEVTFTLEGWYSYGNRWPRLFFAHGRSVTNNWLKYHGGILTRQRAYLKHLRNKRREK